jgi:hypothetical protein
MVDEEVRTKTIHFNDLLRTFMYSKRFGATDIRYAPQGLERRMTHLTAATAMAAPGRGFANDRAGQEYGRRMDAIRAARQWADLVFSSALANFLEKRLGAFHYSVIGGHALIALAAGPACRHLLNDEVAAPDLRGDAAGARSQAGDA